MFRLSFRTGLFLVCLATLLISCFATDEVDTAKNTVLIRGGDTSVLLEGESGKISTVYFKEDDDDDDGKDNSDDDEKEDFTDNNEELLSFQVESLQEVDGDGKPVGLQGPLQHRVSSLDSKMFRFSALDNSTVYQGIPVKTINMSDTVLSNQQGNLRLVVMVFLSAGNVTFGNETFRVQSGTMKFNIEVSDWPFCNASVSCLSQSKQPEIGKGLELTLGIKSEADDLEEDVDSDICVDPDDDPNEEDDDCPIVYKLGGNSKMALNKGVLIDSGNYVAMPKGFPKVVPNGGMNKKVIFQIPIFNNTAILDPSVDVGPPTKKPGNGTGQNSASSVQFISVAFILSSFLVYYR